VRLAAAGLAWLLSAPADAATCRDYGQTIVPALKPSVEALRNIEREAADRIAGLDTRPYDHLLGLARATTAIIADRFGLEQEDELTRCRNYIAPVRRTCAVAAQALVVVIEEQAKTAASKGAKDAYAGAMAPCERFMRFEPLRTALRE
jgi:hypothetical protein